MEIKIKNQMFLEKTEVGISNSDWLIWFLQWQFFCRYETHTAQESGSQLQCHAVMNLQFTHVPSTYRGGLRKSRADWSTVRLQCVTITCPTNLQRFTLYYGSRRLATWCCWTQMSWQVMQRDSDCW